MSAADGQGAIPLVALLDTTGLSPDDVPTVAVGIDSVATATALDAIVAEPPQPLVVVTGDDAGAHALAWAADRAGWLVLEDSAVDTGILAPVATLARDPAPPGRWRGGDHSSADHGPIPTAPASELARAYTARAALVDTQRHEVDRLRAQLVEQRAWVATEAARIRESQSWRLGHRLMRAFRLLTLRRGRGTDALQRIHDRMSEPIE